MRYYVFKEYDGGGGIWLDSYPSKREAEAFTARANTRRREMGYDPATFVIVPGKELTPGHRAILDSCETSRNTPRRSV